MDVDQTGGDNEIGGVDGFCFRTRLRGDDFAVGEPEIGDFVAFVRGVNDATIGNAGDFFHAGRPAPPAQA